MDRLSAVALALLLGLALGAGGCDDDGAEAPPPPTASRFEAVAKKKVERSPEAFCDTYTPGDGAPAFEPPPLSGGATFPGEGWRWVNLWATWCKPCREEMPLLVEWEKKLGGEGAKLDLVFVSVDGSDQVVADFRKDHPDTPESLRVQSMEALAPFLSSVGLGEGAPIPIQIFVGPDDKVRCVRAGAVGEDDLSAVEKILM